MSPPRRRSARLASPKPGTSTNPVQGLKLSSLIERDESPAQGTTTSLNAIVSSPIMPKSAGRARINPITSSVVTTPDTATRVYPSVDEMHPSKAHQSTRRVPDSGLRLGFADPQVTPGQSILSKIETYQNTPSKSRIFATSDSASANRQFESVDNELGPEARKLMQDLREEAARIKQKMIEEKEKERLEGRDADTLPDTLSPRKLAVPKGKRGRFSEVHMEQFKKMDSIAGHPSAFRTQPGRFEGTLKPCLKRTKSQANLDALEPSAQLQKPAQLNSAKRAKVDKPTVRPVSRDGPSLIPLARPQTSLMTPTKASTARSESAKHPRTVLGGFSRTSPSKISRFAPRSAGAYKYWPSPSGLNKFKSLLRMPGSGEGAKPDSNSAQAQAATPKLDIDKQLPSIPGTPNSGIPRSKSLKKPTHTPAKLTKTRPTIENGLTAEAKLETTESLKEGQKELEAAIEYPNLPPQIPSSPAPVNTARPKLTPRAPRSRPSGQSDFTFRSEKSIKFGQSKTTTIRQVRPSTGPINTVTYPALPHGLENKKRHRDDESDNDENLEPMAKKTKGSVIATPDKFGHASIQKPILSSPAKSSSPKKTKGILSLSRLNALARPKERRAAN